MPRAFTGAYLPWTGYTDGPGFTRETAWVVDGAELSQAPAAVVRLMFNIYADEARFPVVEFYQERCEIEDIIYLYTSNVRLMLLCLYAFI